MLADPVLYGGAGIPRGDGRPILLLPGFLAGDQTLSVLGAWLHRIGYRPRVCGSSIYSKGDGVVHWRTQIIPHADCIEVTGSHVGLIFNRTVYRALAHALARPERAERLRCVGSAAR